MFLAFLFLLPILLLIDKTTLKPKKRDLKQYLLIGFLMAIATSLYNTANVFAPIQNVVIINYSYPFFVMIFARFILKEHITKTKLISAFIAIIGLIIVNPFDLEANMLGNILALIGAVAYAFFITKMRQIGKNHSIWSVLWYFLFASIILSPAIFIWGLGDILAVWPYVLGLCVISTGVVYLFFNFALEKLEAEVASIIAMSTTPVIAIILAITILNEPLNTRVIIWGTILVFAWIYLETHIKKYKKKQQKPTILTETIDGKTIHIPVYWIPPHLKEKKIDGVVVVLFDPKIQKYGCISRSDGIFILITWGTDNWESYEQTAKREAREEGWIKEIDEIHSLGNKLYSRYYHTRKKDYRFSQINPYLIITDSTKTQEQILEAHEQDFKLVWFWANELMVKMKETLPTALHIHDVFNRWIREAIMKNYDTTSQIVDFPPAVYLR